MKKLYHFLGSVHFAMTLIGITALIVIGGTFLESATESHLFASHFTYSHPLFSLLLGCFFVNILIAALHRCPFQLRHIPFLTAHIGLLMILAGALTKTFFGLQGTMVLFEGSGSQNVYFPHTLGLSIETQEKVSRLYPLQKCWTGGFSPSIKETDSKTCFPDLQIQLLSLTPHSEEEIQAWIHGDIGKIIGLPPFPVYDWPHQLEPSLRTKSPLFQEIYAFRNSDIPTILQAVYPDRLEVWITDRSTGHLLDRFMLTDAIKNHQAKLQFNGEENFQGILHLPKWGLTISLFGPDSLMLQNSRHIVDLKGPSKLLFAEDNQHNVFLFSITASGEIWSKMFPKNQLDSVVVYGKGFGGYTSLVTLPFPTTRQDKEDALLFGLERQFRQSLKRDPSLSPPLKLFQTSCEKAEMDFVNTFLLFLKKWKESNRWQLNTNQPITHLNWDEVPENDRKGCFWASQILANIEHQREQGEDIIELLEKRMWPLTQQLKILKEGGASENELVTHFIRQVFLLAPQLPLIDHITPGSASKAFCIYLKAYGIELDTILPTPADYEEMQQWLFNSKGISSSSLTPQLTLESPLAILHRPATPQYHLEENIPMVTLQFQENHQKEVITLRYDPHQSNLKQPILGGKYLVRLQTMSTSIPHRLRLRQARALTYPNSTQPFSYECDLIITDNQSSLTEEITLSMNNVWETQDGHRFYLANISSGDVPDIKKVQIAVNRDPAKAFLTYPGVIILVIGMVGLLLKKHLTNK